MTWSFDFTAAPRDGTQILVATNGDKGRLFLTRWLEPTNSTPDGRFDGFPANSKSLLAWATVLDHPNHESPRKAAEAVSERTASTDATIAPVLVEADKAEAVAGGLGQPDMIPALTAQHGGVNVGGPERAGVTGGERAAINHIGILEDAGSGQ